MKEAQVIDLLKGLFGKENVHRFTPGPYSPRGVFDVMIHDSGFNWWIEVKMNDTKISTNQKRFAMSVASPVFLIVKERLKTVRIYHGGLYPPLLDELAVHVAGKIGGVWQTDHRLLREVLSK